MIVHVVNRAKEASIGQVIVATPDHTHYKICKDVIFSNSNLLVVKPLSDTVKEVKSLLKKLFRIYCTAPGFHNIFSKL